MGSAATFDAPKRSVLTKTLNNKTGYFPSLLNRTSAFWQRLSLRLLCRVMWLICGAAAQAGAQAPQFDAAWQQGAVLRGQVAPGTQVEFLTREVRVNEAGQFVIGLGRDAAPEAILTTISPIGERREYRFAVKQRDYVIQRIEGVPQQTVTPDPVQVKRAQQEAELTTRARQLDAANNDFMQAFTWPVIGRISGVYGSQRFYNGEPRAPHYGVDIAVPTGTPVHAPAAGVVTLVHPNMFFSGGTLIVDHGHGLSSTFIHLHKIVVQEGQRVGQGEVIAQAGATGRATGPHLDWRMNWFDQRVDPTLLVEPMAQAKARLVPQGGAGQKPQ